MAQIGTKNNPIVVILGRSYNHETSSRIGQELLALEPPYQNAPLLFWERNEGGQAEVDYVVSRGSDILPLEVKAGATGSLRSLQAFLKEKKGRIGVRISEHPLSLHNQILSIPLYLTHRLESLTEG